MNLSILGLSPLMTNIIAIVIVVVILATLWYFGKKKEVLMAIDYLVEEAEKKFGSGIGELKYNSVVTTLYPELPFIIKLFVSPVKLDDWIELSVDGVEARIDKEISKL